MVTVVNLIKMSQLAEHLHLLIVPVIIIRNVWDRKFRITQFKITSHDYLVSRQKMNLHGHCPVILWLNNFELFLSLSKRIFVRLSHGLWHGTPNVANLGIWLLRVVLNQQKSNHDTFLIIDQTKHEVFVAKWQTIE